MNTITYEEFQKLDIRMGKIVAAERVPGTDKLLKLSVDLGGETRQLVAGIAESYATEYVVGKVIPVLANLQPREIRGVESRGMILCPLDSEGKPVLLVPEQGVPAGAQVK
jgi:methionyl-tRNA synthetase